MVWIRISSKRIVQNLIIGNIHKRIYIKNIQLDEKKHMHSIVLQTSLFGLYNWQSQSNLSSGTLIRASLGSMVQKGKFSAGIDNLVRVLKRVDFPTFGNPTYIKK